MLVPFKEFPASEVLARYRQKQSDGYDRRYIDNPQKPVPSAVHIFAQAALCSHTPINFAVSRLKDSAAVFLDILRKRQSRIYKSRELLFQPHRKSSPKTTRISFIRLQIVKNFILRHFQRSAPDSDTTGICRTNG
jgi:hypothetical protein